MNQRITRRRFGQLAIAGTAAGAIALLASKTFAQVSSIVFVGVRPGSPSTNNADTNLDSSTVDSTDDAASTTAASTAQELVRQSLDVGTQVVGPLATPQVLQDGTTPILQSDEELSGFTSLADGTLVLAITPVGTSNKGDTPTRLTFLRTSPTAVTVSGLTKQEKLESLVGTNDGRLLGLVVKKNGTPPAKLVNIDVNTGAISNNNDFTLPSNVRYSNLAQCPPPDGKIYMTAVDRQGATSLVQLDPEQKKPITLAQLNVNGTVWNNGLQSLVCSTAGQLFAFGALRYQLPNNLYLLDPKTGAMTQPIPFDVAKVTLSVS